MLCLETVCDCFFTHWSCFQYKRAVNLLCNKISFCISNQDPNSSQECRMHKSVRDSIQGSHGLSDCLCTLHKRSHLMIGQHLGSYITSLR